MTVPADEAAAGPGMVKADLGFGCLLIVLGLGIVLESWRMPRFADQGVSPWSVPGIVPGILGLVLVALAVVLVLRAVRRLQAADGTGATAGPLAGLDVRRIALALALTLGYAGGLVGRVPFWLATFLFVGAFVLAFEWRPGGGLRWRSLLAAVVLGAAVSGVVSAVFRHVFLIRLP